MEKPIETDGLGLLHFRKPPFLNGTLAMDFSQLQGTYVRPKTRNVARLRPSKAVVEDNGEEEVVANAEHRREDSDD